MPAWGLALLSVFALALVSLVGAATFALGRERLERTVFLFVAFAVGTMLGGAFLHLIPEAYAHYGDGTRVGLLVLAGVAVFFVLEKVLHWHHEHGAPEALDAAAGHTGPAGHAHGPEPFTLVAFAGNAGHKIIDGAIVAAAFLVSPETGFVTALAVLVHEVPQQIGMYGVLVYGGFTRGRALALNFVAGLSGLIGAAGVLLLGQVVTGLAEVLLPVTAGAFLYIAGSDLIPELNRRHSTPATKSVGQIAMMALGVALVVLVRHGH